ncbi:hypothetical protein AAG747_23665 [Rapidithrix thailandica]|uniref:SprB repeat-containing protein n=1 Tax=Rapidithrix thailandica TaxID=413964 RepID=A0AAW9SEZ5_9BACT
MNKLNLLLLVFFVSCEWEQLPPPVDCTISDLRIQLEERQMADCGVANGGLTVQAQGGVPPYSYSTLRGKTSSMGLFTGLAAGVYTVMVEDSKGCEAAMEVVVANQSGVNIQTIDKSEANCGASNGSIEVMAEGGEAPYSYRIGSENFQENNRFNNLPPGIFEITVRDQNGCESVQAVQLNSSVSYSNTIAPIIQNNCAISGCHNGTQAPDLRSFNTVRANATNIKQLTGNRTMPLEGSLSQNEIDQIACWVDDGALNN